VICNYQKLVFILSGNDPEVKYNDKVATLDDNQLVERVVNGDEAAFLALYDRHSRHIYALSLRILHDPMLAEEATQDTFLKLWGHARQFLAERGSLLIWLLTIARRTALDRIRLEARRPNISDSVDPDDVWPSIPDPATNSEENRWRSMYYTVQALPFDQRQVVELAYYQGMSQTEIAETLGWPLGTVKTRLRSAMEQLRQAMIEK
jgi:RNA polymerase sigma-70 factor (ECF subfamily)